MAGKDYAPKKSAPAKGGGGRTLSPLRSTMIVIGILLVVAMSFAGGFWLGQEKAIQQADSEEKKALQAELATQKAELEKLRAARQGEAGTTQVGDLTFYNELPKQPVTPEPVKSTPTAKPAPTTATAQPARNLSDIAEKELATAPADSAESRKMLDSIIERELQAGGKPAAKAPPTAASKASGGGSYRLQVGSVRSRSDADKLANDVRKLGLPAEVKQVEIAGKGTWLRVYAGPFASRAEADKADVAVQGRLHIHGMVVHGQ